MAEAHPGRVGRRLAAIVAADVAGYSRLMGLDEVGTARTLREHRKVTDALVAKHGGRKVIFCCRGGSASMRYDYADQAVGEAATPCGAPCVFGSPLGPTYGSTPAAHPDFTISA
jgi:class 3 adenylate cyclase